MLECKNSANLKPLQKFKIVLKSSLYEFFDWNNLHRYDNVKTLKHFLEFYTNLINVHLLKGILENLEILNELMF